MPDMTPFAICILPVIAILILAVGILLGRYTSPSRREMVQNQGEAIVRRMLTNTFQPPQFHLLNNITIPFEDGSTQIDHILISTKGIFVIETKHYSGWIFANAQSAQWTQVIYHVKNKFPNPLHQNMRHVKAVRQLLDFIPTENVYSAVVFTGNGEFKAEIPDKVFNLLSLANYIRSFEEDVLTPNRMQFCVGRIECARYQISRQTDVEHVAYLNRKFGKAT